MLLRMVPSEGEADFISVMTGLALQFWIAAFKADFWLVYGFDVLVVAAINGFYSVHCQCI
jgi:uncharacterized membrane protein YoaK (UPF0700 family)